MSDHNRELDRVVAPVAKAVAEDENLRITGSGGKMMDEVEEINFWFNAARRADRDEARRLYVRIVERFRAAVNEDEPLRPHLAEFPFPATRFDIFITFEDESGDFQKEGAVAGVSMIKGALHFTVYDPETERLTQLGDHEPYEEALRTVQAEQ